MNDNSHQVMDNAAECIKTLQAEIDTALLHLSELCTVDGKLSTTALDAHQQVSYELAFCVAELAAAKVLLEYAGHTMSEDPVVAPLALTFCADQLRSVWARLFNHANDAGLCSRRLLSVMSRDPLDSFLQTHGDVSRLASIGEQLLERGEARLPNGLDDEKNLVRENFARFADQVVMPKAAHIHRNDTDIPDEIISGAAETGCFGSSIPERFGGLMTDNRHDSVTMLIITEELSRASLGAAGSLITRPEIAARALLEGGTVAQQNHWLPQLASGDKLAAIAFTEPDYGSDVASLSLRATPTEGGWTLSGAKTWCTFAGRAELIMILARTNPDRKQGHRGLSMFLIEKPPFSGHEFVVENPSGGRLRGNAIPTIGYRGMHSFDLAFDDYFVPGDSLIGGETGEGKGFYLAMAGLSGGRIQTSARACGVMAAALDRSMSWACDRVVFGAPVGHYQLTRIKLARMWAAVVASRQFGYAVARLLDNGGGKMEASLVKLFSCRAAEKVTREALQLHGGMGYAEESDVSRYFVDARVLSIFEGAEETLALKVIARDLIANINTKSP